jgi:DNA-binding NtrC family response regulator
MQFNQRSLVSGMARVLAIDDDGAVCATVGVILERAGHQVVTAQDGRRGLKCLEAEHFDLLLIDIFMPEMDGLETIRVVRKSRSELPIIVMSGATIEKAKMPDYLSFATKLGAIESLRKPFKPAALVDVVDRCLAHRAKD